MTSAGTPNNRLNWREWFKALLLLGLGIYFVFMIATGGLDNYINLRFMWLSYVAVALFFIIGLWNAYSLYTSSGPSILSYGGTDHSPVSWGTLAIVSIPLLLGTGLPSQPLGAEAVAGNISTTAVAASAAAAQRPPLERDIMDWLREFNNTTSPAAFDGEPLDVIGFIYREPGFADHEFMIARFTMSCCVADAFAIGMPVDGSAVTELSGFDDGQWVRITGTLQAQMFDGDTMPVIQPDNVEVIDEPDNPYLYS